ncbi:structural maintenance of chromosomes protein 4 isoform X2 [Ceratina calcarata]|nr:structural maintenance of chromosomes protein 4 isoform X2 [Ceratina calcarata]
MNEMTDEVAKNNAVEEMEVEEEDIGLDMDEEGGLRVDDDIYIPPPLPATNQLNSNGPRLMINKIVNENFKSYGGTKVIGPFHKCFSAIIGPNGNGKSNAIDSMLFVFGYRASKIRSKKLSVLIHKSEQYQNITKCTVSVHFQQIIDKPGTDYDVVPNSEFVISRSAFKDNSSYYELNKKKVQFKEIAKLLRSHGVDLIHNRFLILQGEVEQIAMMKPKSQNENETGMLEYLEDIIGTVRFKEPIEKLSEKVDLLTEYRAERLNRLRMVEKEKEGLEEPMQEAIQYLEVENAITKLQHEIYCHQRYKTTEELAQQEGKVNELETDMSNLMSKMKEISDEKEEKRKVMEERSKAWNDLQKRKDKIDTEFDNLRKHDESLHAEFVETNKRRKANIASLRTEKSNLEEQSKVPEKSTKNIQECEELVEKHMKSKEKEEAELEKLMADLSRKTEPLANERSKLEKTLISLRKDVDQAQATFNIAQSELELYMSVELKEKEKLEKLRQSLKSTTNNLNAREEELKSLTNKIPHTEQKLAEAQQEWQTVKTKDVEMSSKLRDRRISFEEQRAAMQANRSRNRIVDTLMREKREGRIPGVFGRLGDLGAINGKYDVAISTACGPLDNIVVDTVATAQACIMFLRQNDIGRATFIPLEKQQRFLSKCKEKIRTPENVPRLFDLIQVEDERVLPAFYYGLQDTLVANDLDQATRIAYGQQRFRVVSLKGELIELSGTMSGGGKTVSRGRMGQKVVRNELSAADIEKLELDLSKLSEECNQYRARGQELENQVHSLNVSLKDMKVNKEKLRIDVKALQEEKVSLLAQIKVQEQKAKDSVSDPRKVEQLEKAMNGAKKNLEKVSENSSAIESQVNRINKEIEDLSGGSVKEKQKHIASLNKAIDKGKAEICRLQVAIKTAERNVKKLERQIETLENDIHNSEQRLRDIQKERQELEEKGREYLKLLEELKQGLSERDEAMSSFKEELNGLQTRENKLKAIKIDLDQKLKEHKSIMKELKHTIPELTKRIAGMKLQVIPGKNTEELKNFTEDELSMLDANALVANLQKTKKRLPAEVPNMQVIEEYKEKDALYLQRAADVEKMTVERNRMREIYETARRRRIQEFLAGFTIITDKLKEMYQMITLGGDAELELVDSLDPFSEGIAFSVRPPKKSWKNICNLSGGEKTLSSLALVFALHHYKPTPLYFMDEIDAALDFKNVSIVGNYIKERTKNAQFIIISLRSNMFELADYLVGIYKTYNCTKCVTIDVGKYYENSGIAPPSQVTSKSQYSQMQKFRIQTQTQTRENCTPISVQSDKDRDPSTDLLSQLPPLGLCPTPEKVPPNNVTENNIKEATHTRHLKKKRKL